MDNKYLYFYFAYGSNMSLKQMAQRCPDSIHIGRAKLAGYLFRYDGVSKINWGGSSVANIIKHKDGLVWGVTYALSAKDVTNLDQKEHLGTNYFKTNITITDDVGKQHKAFTYKRPPQTLSQPSAKYQGVVLKAAVYAKLPQTYIDEFLKNV